MLPFHKVLCRLRAEAGYPSSRSFFKGQGGQAFFKCTYRQYINVENGKSSTNARLVGRIALALALTHEKKKAREFFAAYLRTLAGDDDVVKFIINAFSDTPQKMKDVQPPMVRSMARVSKTQTKDLTQDQARFLTSSRESFWTFVVLTHDRGSWTEAGIAQTVGLSAAKVKKALDRLMALKLVTRDKNGKYRCPHVGKTFRHPTTKMYNPGKMPLTDFRKEMVEKKGAVLMRYQIFSRASEAELRQYFSYLVQSVLGAGVCATYDPGPDTMLFDVSTEVRKIMPF